VFGKLVGRICFRIVRMKTCCFVTQEDQNGVVTLIRETILHWPENDDRLMVLCNQGHWAYEQFQELKKNNKIQIVTTCPFLSCQDICKKIRNKVKHPVVSKFLRGIVHLLRPLLSIWYVFRLKKLFLEFNVNAVFSHNGGYPGGELNRLAVIAAKLAGIQKNYMIIHSHPIPISPLFALAHKLEDKLIAFSAMKIFSVSRSCAKVLQEQRFGNTAVEVITNGFRVESLEDTRKINISPSWRTKKTVIFFVGDLLRSKGLDVLFDALIGLNEAFTLVLYGSGSEEFTNHLKQRAGHLKHNQQVYFEGYHPNASYMIKYCDLLVFPPIAEESFGMVLLEAMYWKKPVICSDFGGMKDIVQHEHTGLVVQAGNAEALQEAISYIINNPDLAKQWGVNGYERLKNRFDIRHVAEKYYRLS